MKESDIQKTILQYLNFQPDIFAWRQGSTGVYDPTSKLFRRLGGFSIKGVSDILGIVSPGGKILAIEVKRPGGKVSLEQLAFISKVSSMGGYSLIAYSLDDVIQFVKGINHVG